MTAVAERDLVWWLVERAEMWWKYPLCQRCGSSLLDSQGNPRWYMDHNGCFVCPQSCRTRRTRR